VLLWWAEVPEILTLAVDFSTMTQLFPTFESCYYLVRWKHQTTMTFITSKVWESCIIAKPIQWYLIQKITRFENWLCCFLNTCNYWYIICDCLFAVLTTQSSFKTGCKMDSLSLIGQNFFYDMLTLRPTLMCLHICYFVKQAQLCSIKLSSIQCTVDC